MRLRQPPRKKGRIEIVPMIDAIFFLLVFFMFSSLSMVRMNGMGVALPQSGGGSVAESGKASGAAGGGTKVWVSLSDEGLISIDGTPMNPGNVSAMLRAKLAGQKSGVIIVQPEPDGKMQRVVALMDVLNEVTLADGSRPSVLIATDPVDKPSEKP